MSDVSQDPGVGPRGSVTVDAPEPPTESSGTSVRQGSRAWTVVLIVLTIAAVAGAAVFLLNAFGVITIELERGFWPVWMTSPTDWLGKLVVMVFAIALFVFVMTIVLLAADRSSRIPNWLLAAAFIGPAVLMIGLGLLYPAIRTIRQSFFDRTSENFVGWDNYQTILGNSTFQSVLINTLIWVLLVPLASTGIGLVYAVLVDRTRFEALAKGLIFLPMAISLVGAAIIWRFIYTFRPEEQNQIGLANQLLVWLGFEPYQFIITDTFRLNTLFLIVVLVWIQTGFAMTILSAAIKNIPDDIIEAARLDGLTGFRMFRSITVPSIRPALIVVLVAITITTLKAFDIVYTMTGGNFNTSVVANEFYFQAFRQFNFGLGSTLAVILFIVVIPIVIYQVRQLRIAEEIR